MKICILTSHNPRHYHFANSIASLADKALIVSSAMGLNPAVAGHHGETDDSLVGYFEERFRTELEFFPDRFFAPVNGGVLVVGPDEINASYVYNQVEAFKPDVMVVFGTNILKGPILKASPVILNMHLGLSPYFNGTSSNFWPMYLGKLEYIGVTIHYLDAGIDTGNILGQTRAQIIKGDTPHTIGNRTILAGIKLLKEILNSSQIYNNQGIKQWKSDRWPIYKMRDFTKEVEKDFMKKLSADLINNWVENNDSEDFPLVSFDALKGPVIVNSAGGKMTLDISNFTR